MMRARIRTTRILALCLSATLPLVLSRALALSPTSTFAGGGAGAITSGTDSLSAPRGISVRSDGTALISDSGNDRIRKVSPSGHITSLTLDAQIDAPDASVLVSNGDLLVSEPSTNRVRRVTPSGEVSTFAGGGVGPGPTCVGACVQIVGDGLLATEAQLRTPSGLAVDQDGNVFISDSGNHRVRKVAPDGVITTVAGNGVQGFSGDGGKAKNAKLNTPISVAVLPSGDLVVADLGNNRLRLVTQSGDIVTIAGTGLKATQGDGGQALRASFYYLRSVAVDTSGQIFLIDQDRIRTIDGSSIITTYAGSSAGYSGDNGPASSAQFRTPRAMTLAGGSAYIADTDNNRLRRISAAGTVTSIAGTGSAIACCSDTGLDARSARLSSPRGIARNAAGDTFISDSGHHRILKVAANGSVTTFVGTGDAGFLGDGGSATSAWLNFPRALAVDPSGNLLIADGLNYRIRKVDASSGVISTFAGSNCSAFSGDGGPATSACLRTPYGIATDASGNAFIADTGNSRIRKVDTTGKITTVAGNNIRGYTGDGGLATASGLNFPHGVTVALDGQIYVADTFNSRIRKVDAAGRISTIAGSGPLPCNQFVTVFCDQGAYLGDGGRATSAYLNQPYDVAVDDDRNIFIADTGNDRIRRVDGAGNIWTVAGNGVFGIDGNGELEYILGPEAVEAVGGSAILFSDTGHGTVILLQARSIV